MRNTLHYGDCLNVMADLPDKCVDLIYLDPPFNSKTNYNLLFPNPDSGEKTKSEQPHLAQIIAFHDTWTWDGPAAERVKRIENAVAHPAHKAIKGLNIMLGESGSMAYLSYMAERLVEMKRLLKPTGSIYLHCDPTMSHYLKALMDEIFGYQNFRNEIVWHYGQRTSFLRRFLSKKHDVILFYARSRGTMINKVSTPWDKADFLKHRHDVKVDEDGNEFIWTDGGAPGKRYKRMVEEVLSKGKPIDTVWNMPILNSASKERLGYPTQKPVSLIERVLKISTSPGDIVLDPFCGCGTTIEAAHKLRRDWIGIDISPFAVDLIQKRRMKGIPIEVRGVPQDLSGAQKLARDNPFDFEKWAISRIPGLAPNAKQRGDGGIDGRGLLLTEPDDHDSKLVLAQTKGGKFNASNLRDFLHVIERDRAAMGVYITLSRQLIERTRSSHTERQYPFRSIEVSPRSIMVDSRSLQRETTEHTAAGRPLYRKGHAALAFLAETMAELLAKLKEQNMLAG